MIRQTIGLALAGAVLATGITLAQAADEELEKAVAAAWKAQDKALSEHDVDAVMATWIDAEDSVLLGTGPGERWVGMAEIREAFDNIIKDFDPYTMESVCGWHVIGAQGDTAWGLAECDFSDSLAGTKREFPLNVSAVLVKQDDAWKFRALHFSTLTSGAKQ
jgi:ketosteroid isomerase-like protein